MVIRRKEKNFISRLIFNQKSLVILGLIIIIFVSIRLVENLKKRYYVNKEIKELEKEIAGLENKNLNFEELLTYLESEQFIEEQARLNLGLKKEGEEVVIVQSDNNQPKEFSNKSKESQIYTTLGKKEVKPTSLLTNPRKWWNYFFSKKASIE